MSDIVESLRAEAASHPGTVSLDAEAADEIERLREELARIVQWSEAYPLDVFPEPDLKRVRAALEKDGLTLDCVAAWAMRRVIEGVGKLAREALR